MPVTDPASWSEALRQTLQHYDEPLVRQVSAKLVKPRGQWPVEELIERCVAAAGNAAVIDRRLEDLDPACRRLLALIGHSRQPRWKLGNLLELLAALGHVEGPRPVFTLFEAGLLYPDLTTSAAPAPTPTADRMPRLKNFEQWLGQASATGFTVFAHPLVVARALKEDLGLPECPGATAANGAVHEADGLEWLLRAAIVWQQVAAAPMRRTQQGGFFKRDLERLRDDPLLNSPPPEGLVELPDTGLLAIALATIEGLVQDNDGELTSAAAPPVWDEGLPAALASLWAALPHLESWNPLDGWRGQETPGSPFPSAYLLALLPLTRLPDDGWASPAAVGQWVLEHHPYWSAESVRPSRLKNWAPTFLLGLAYQLRLVQAAKDAAGEWLVRLSPLGRWVLGVGDLPARPPSYAKTLTVQPTLEIVAFRQGLTPALIARLGRFAAWKSLGSACTLQLQPDTVYRALEAGETFETILQALEQHGMKATPAPVIESLRTWSNKRERISVYPSATLMEFNSEDDLSDALARGLPGVRLSDRLAVVTNEDAIDFRHFRLMGTRDYALSPEKCVDVEPDGVTLTLDAAKSDLLLETELPRFAELLERPHANGRRQYRLTPASLAAGRESGLSVGALEAWFHQRAGQPLSAAARLLLTGPEFAPVQLQRHLVLHVLTPDLADGLVQWPGTRSLVAGRLGPTALIVAEEHVEELRERLQTLGVRVQ